MIEAKDFLEFSDLVTQDAQNGGEVNYIVDFYANWCQPCKIVARHLDSIQDQLPAKIVKINIETEEGRATAHTWHQKYSDTGVLSLRCRKRSFAG